MAHADRSATDGGTSGAGPPRGRGRPTENLAAYNLYLQGRYHLNQRTEEGLRKAVEFFDKAIVEDAQYAQAYSGLADAYSLLGHYGVLAPAEVWTKTASNAAWAVLQDEHSAEAHTSLAHVKSTQDWDWLGAEREFQRALSLDPRYPTAHHWYAVSCLAPMGRLDDAREEMLLAQALDPISSIIARDRRPRTLLPAGFRGGAGAVRPHDRTESALLAGLLDSGPGAGAARRVRRIGGGIPESDSAFAQEPDHAGRPGTDVCAVGKTGRGAADPAGTPRPGGEAICCRRSNWHRSTSRWVRRTRASSG